jgi:hypothetical protein
MELTFIQLRPIGSSPRYLNNISLAGRIAQETRGRILSWSSGR